MSRHATARRAGEPAPLLLVCDDRARGRALAAALGRPDTPVFDAAAVGGWEVVPADTVVLFERAPDLSRTRRRLRFARGARVIVVVWPEQPRLVELVLREKGVALAWPGSVEALAAELRRCLEGTEGSVLVEPRRLADGLCDELSRRLQRNAPHLRLADETRVEALLDKLTCAILEEARAIEAAPVADLDWEHLSTAVQTPEESAVVRRRAAVGAPNRDPLPAVPPPAPDPLSIMETRPYSSPTSEQIELALHVELLDDDPRDDDEDARAPSRPPPLPARPSVPAVALDGRRGPPRA
ncbi:MAG: hypothetical protein KF729_33295, partial [Sandaracinaceae bacterium]|nr:hypothetical protein [Sandaracinaceae bacterium]